MNAAPDRLPALDDQALKLGLMMESARAQQALAATHLERLTAHTRDIDGVVREEIRRTLIEELGEVTAETQRAARALQALRRSAHLHGISCSVLAAVLCTAIPTAVVRWVLPSRAQIAQLRAQRDALTDNLARLERRGARVEWRSCGADLKLCVRVDAAAPVYGPNADYRVVKERNP